MSVHERFLMLVLNVGSTSTKAAIFENDGITAHETITYHAADLSRFKTLADQLPLREKDLLAFMEAHGITPERLDLIVSRGGLMKPAPAGIYEVTPAMCDDLMEGKYGIHPSALGPAIALSMARASGKQAIVADAPSTDEFHDLARLSGLPGIARTSAFHALNQKAVARRAARAMGSDYSALNLIVAHMGGGTTIGAHRKGRVIDCTHGLAEGPFTAERAGGLPSHGLIEYMHQSGHTVEDMKKELVGKGGLVGYLGTDDAREVEAMIEGGDEKARLVFEAMAYQVAKDIGAMATVLEGKVDAVVFTGGLAHSAMLVRLITDRVGFIAPVLTYPGENELVALAEAGLRVLRGEDKMLPYD